MRRVLATKPGDSLKKITVGNYVLHYTTFIVDDGSSRMNGWGVIKTVVLSGIGHHVHQAFGPLYNGPPSSFEEYDTANPTMIRGHRKPSKDKEGRFVDHEQQQGM